MCMDEGHYGKLRPAAFDKNATEFLTSDYSATKVIIPLLFYYSNILMTNIINVGVWIDPF